MSAIVVMAKPAVAGEVKTRLIGHLGAEGAAALHARLLDTALATARTAAAASGAQVVLAGTQPAASPHWDRWRGLAAFIEQGEGDLGARMERVFAQLVGEHDRVVMIGADCPELAAADLTRALDALTPAMPLVFAAAEDGGYVLIGAVRVIAEVFRDLPWSTPRLLQETCARLTARHIDYRIRGTFHDIDRPADYERLCAAGAWPRQRRAA